MADSVTSIPRRYVAVQSDEPQSPFEGQLWVDSDNGDLFRYINGQWSKVGADVEFIQNFMNDQAALNERHDLELSINAWNYDDGFIDIFWDQSKISSSANLDITTGSNPEIKLTSINGSTVTRPADGRSSTSSAARGIAIKPNTDLAGVDAVISDNSSGYSRAYLADDQGNLIDEVDISGKSPGDTVRFRGTMSSGSRYNLLMDDQGNTVTKGKEGSPNFPYTSTDVDIVDGNYSGGGFNDGDSVTYIDSNAWAFNDVTAFPGYDSSGTLTHTRKDLEFTPSKIVATPEYTLNGQSADLVVSDNSGNSITISPGEFESEQAVSFSDGNIQAQWQIGSDGSSTPVIKQTKLLGVE
jgi:hypothetical protein